MLTSESLEAIRRATGADAAIPAEHIQGLWSGYGEIRRVRTPGGRVPSVIVKRVQPPSQRRHPRGWVSDLSHQRKLRSYAVETAFYQKQALRCGEGCPVPTALLCQPFDAGWLLVMQDMDAAGYPRRLRACGELELRACLAWLAAFHATFLGEAPDGLWGVGTYWHLATRPEELAASADAVLVAAAPLLDARLNNCRYSSLVHGDAKVANFCFASDGAHASALDFQYVGGGAGIKDVAYLLSSCLDNAGCETRAEAALDDYFLCLRRALAARGQGIDGAAVETEWRALYPFAWADFCRFLSGWAPDHVKLHGYSRRMTRQALDAL